ncbi:MAG: LysR family transcriptional regulator [Steroidobacteraceae bacterium]
MDKLRAMRTFVQIADSGSLTAAAGALDTSLSAVVRILASLERDLGVRLLNRTTRRLGLTAEGRAYLDNCREILSALTESEASLRTHSKEPSGHIVLTAPVLFGRMYVAPALTRFLRRQPKVTCELLLFDRIVNLLEEKIDIGVRIGKLEDSSLVAQRIGDVRRVVAANPTLLKQVGRPSEPHRLSQLNCITTTNRGGTWTFCGPKARKISIPVRGNLQVNHIGPAIDACAAGLGFGQFLSYQIAPLVAAGKLEIVLASHELPPLPIHVVYPSRGLLPLRTRTLIEHLQKELVAGGSLVAGRTQRGSAA